MTDLGSPPGRWRYGLHPGAAGMRVRSLERVELQLGEALRLEMEDGSDKVHLQYFIATELGPWALWLSCAPAEVAADESAIEGLAPPSEA
jgi:hypothetical protein